jgi:O-antigen/teichoic acid export membrane protein
MLVRRVDRGTAAVRRLPTAMGGIAAQGSQAAASLTLQLVTVRLLGLEALGVYAALYGLLVVGTALTTGFVGDALTVLERRDPDVRSGLQAWLIVLAMSCGSIAVVIAWASGAADGPTALLFGIAVVVALVEDSLRRLLMANLRFWRIVTVDGASMLVSVAVIISAHAAGHLTIRTVIIALALGQLVALLVAIAQLPEQERWVSTGRPRRMDEVAAYGVWRALQQMVRPALQASIRWTGLLLVSALAVGQLEAGRLYVAPVMIVVGGVGSVIFARYAGASSDASAARCDRDALRLGAAVVGVLVLGLAARPVLEPLLLGASTLSTAAVAGWALNAVGMALATPYVAMAAVNGRHVRAFTVRLVESLVVLLVTITAVSSGASLLVFPYLAALGALGTALVMRMAIKEPVIERSAPRRSTSGV